MEKKYHIKGLHCIACETLVEEELAKLPGVKSQKVSHKDGQAIIEQESESRPDVGQIKAAIEKHGYKLEDGRQEPNVKYQMSNVKFRKQIIDSIIALSALGALFFLASHFDLSRFFPDTSGGISVLAAIGIGIVASLSTCLALTGGLVIGLSAKMRQESASVSLAALSRIQIMFHAGRLASFFIFGGILGLLGQSIGYSLHMISMLSGLVAIVMLYLGLNILGIVPDISRWGLHLPKSFAGRVGARKESAPALLGALTFFLPCGFTQSMQLLAVASGSFIQGGLIMLLFALGTVPVLFAVGLGASLSQRPGLGILKKAIGILVIFFALYSLKSALIVSGFSWPSQTDNPDIINTPTQTTGEQQVVKMDLDYYFMQEEFRIKKDVPVRWEINAINISGCSNEVIIPRLGISSGKLKKGLNVVEFTATESGVLPFSCWMGMLSGRFIVE